MQAWSQKKKIQNLFSTLYYPQDMYEIQHTAIYKIYIMEERNIID